MLCCQCTAWSSTSHFILKNLHKIAARMWAAPHNQVCMWSDGLPSNLFFLAEKQPSANPKDVYREERGERGEISRDGESTALLGICFSAKPLSQWPFFPYGWSEFQLLWLDANAATITLLWCSSSPTEKQQSPMLWYCLPWITSLDEESPGTPTTWCWSIMFLQDWMASCDREAWSFRQQVGDSEQSHPLQSVPREHPKASLQQGAWGRQTLPQGVTSFPSSCENPLGSLAGSLLGKTQHYFIFKGLEYSACLWPLSASALFVALPSKVIVHIL